MTRRALTPQELLDSLLRDYYRAGQEARNASTGPADRDWKNRQFVIMDQARKVIARMTGRDEVSILFALEHGIEIPLTGHADAIVVNQGPPVGDADCWIVYGGGRARVRVDDRLAELNARYNP